MLAVNHILISFVQNVNSPTQNNNSRHICRHSLTLKSQNSQRSMRKVFFFSLAEARLSVRISALCNLLFRCYSGNVSNNICNSESTTYQACPPHTAIGH